MISEPWQVFDAPTPELLSRLHTLSSCNSLDEPRKARLVVLIEEELAERGHLDSFLSTLVDLDPNTSSKQAALQHPLCLTSPSSASSCFQPDNAFGNTAQQPTCEVSLLAATTMTTGTSSTLTPYDAVASCDDQSNQANSSTSASHRSDAANSQLLPADFSVLQAAVAAYKQEKKQLWKARKAGKQAGWGFTKAASTWPKPDSSASEALGPLRMSMRSTSLAPPQGSAALAFDFPSRAAAPAQPLQQQQQSQPHIHTAQQCQPQATDMPPAQPHSQCLELQPAAKPLRQSVAEAAHDMASLAEASTGGAGGSGSVRAQMAQQNPVNRSQQCMPGASCDANMSGISGPPDLLDGSFDQQSKQNFSNGGRSLSPDAQRDTAHCQLELPASKEHAVPGMLEPVFSAMLATTSALQQSQPALHHRLTHPSPQDMSQAVGLWRRYADEEKQSAESDACSESDTCTESCAESQAEVNAGQCDLQTEQPVMTQQLMQSQSVWSENTSEAGSAVEAEVGMPSSTSHGHDTWVPADAVGRQQSCVAQGQCKLGTEVLDGHEQEGCLGSPGTAQILGQAPAPWQSGAAGSANQLHQSTMPHRLSDWNMHNDDGLCSWPSTPLHDPTSHESSCTTLPMAQKNAWRAKHGTKLQNMHKWGSNDETQGGSFTKLLQGERLTLA